MIELRKACVEGNVKKVKELIEISDNIDPLCLAVAACNGYFDVVKLLVEAGVDVSHNNYRALELAAVNGFEDIVDYLIKNDALITEEAVMEAFDNGQEAVLNIFRKYYNKEGKSEY